MNNYRKIVSILFLAYLFALDDDVFHYSLDFIDSKSTENHFMIEINAQIEEGFYMSSSEADKDRFQFQTRIEWPQSEDVGRSCFDGKGNEFIDDWGFPLFFEGTFKYTRN